MSDGVNVVIECIQITKTSCVYFFSVVFKFVFY